MYYLTGKSSVFEKMFLANMKEKMENRVEIKDIDKWIRNSIGQVSSIKVTALSY